jgi:hypothetical protein
MGVLRDVLDRLEREDELKAEVLTAMRAFERVNGETPLSARDEHGFTPELVTAIRRYARALTEQGEYLIDKAKHYEDAIAKYQEET